MQAVAKAKMTRTSPRKISLVAALIRQQPASQAQVILANTNKSAAGTVALVLNAAIANAENNLNLKKADLVVESVLVGAGPTLKRVRQRSRGQLNRIMKRTSHITVILSDQGAKETVTPVTAEASSSQTKAKPATARAITTSKEKQ